MHEFGVLVMYPIITFMILPLNFSGSPGLLLIQKRSPGSAYGMEGTQCAKKVLYPLEFCGWVGG